MDALKEYLISRGLVDASAIEAAEHEQRVTRDELGIILMRNGFLRQQDFTEALLHLDPAALEREHVFVSSIPSQVLIELRTVMVAETSDKLYAATVLPESLVRSRLAEYDPRPVEFFPVNFERLESYLDELERVMSADEDSFLDRQLRHALAVGASDIHIIPRHNTYTMMMRRLGVREIVHEGDLDEYNTLVARIKDRAKLDISERRIPQSGGFGMEHRKRMVDMRVECLPTAANNEQVVIRVLDPDAVNPRLSKLGITKLEEWRKAITRADGLCLVCGPTGSGKTTTLNATVRELDRFGRAIYTVEDPVEYRIPYTGQVPINPAVGLDFAKAIRSFMRADPDIILVGELRDEETARTAIKAAETGHLVLATLHTGSIYGAVERLRDLGVKPEELKFLLRGVLVQRLIRVFCNHCAGDGCARCNDSGFGSRSIASECTYFRSEADVKRLLAGEVWWDNLVQDAVNKHAAGMTSRAEIERVFAEEAVPYLNALEGQADG